MTPIMRPAGLIIGGLFLVQGLYFLLSALVGRGNWLQPVSRVLARIFKFLAKIFSDIRGVAAEGGNQSGNEFGQVGCMFIGAIFMMLPCVGIMAVYYWLDPMHEIDEILGLWDFFVKFLNTYDLLGLIYLALFLLVLYYVVEKIFAGLGEFISWSAEWLSQENKVRRQLGTAALLSTLGAAGLMIGTQAPTAEAYINSLLTPTTRPTSAVPTATLAWYQASDDFSGQDLSRINLANVRLRGKNFAGANLSYANLQRAYLWAANFENADLTGADLGQTWLVGANLKAAILTRANLMYADLTNADLTAAQLELVQVTNCCLGGAKMQDGTQYDGRFNTFCDTAAMESLLDSDGLDPTEQFQVKHYLKYYNISHDEWLAGQAWAKEHLEDLRAKSNAWYAEHWPDQ